MEIKYSPLGAFKLLAISILGAAVCYGYVGYYAKHFSYSPGLYGAAWVSLVVFAGCSILSLFLCSRRGVALEFTTEGIIDYRGKWPPIRWDQISRIRPMRLGISDMLIIHPKDGFPKSIKLDPDGTTSFGFTGLKPNSTNVFAWLRNHHPELID